MNRNCKVSKENILFNRANLKLSIDRNRKLMYAQKLYNKQIKLKSMRKLITVKVSNLINFINYKSKEKIKQIKSHERKLIKHKQKILQKY